MSNQAMSPEEIAEHFWTKANKEGPVPAHRPELGPCWVWTDYCKLNGYGQFYVNRRPVYAHRFSYALAHGRVPGGLKVLHHCDYPPCVRPDHLFAGTGADNMADAVQKGRIPRGESRAQAQITDAQVAALRSLFAGRRRNVARDEKKLLAGIMGISVGHLNEIVAGRARTL